jgi:D-glycero-D-manno-heptose 1,7-bisphosphate phosphatase
MSKIVILDRDGVINEDSDSFIKTVEECHLIPGTVEAISRLTRSGYKVFIASNQSGIARGLLDEFDLANIHQFLIASIEEGGGFIEGIVYCPHGPNDNCDCRKPKPGLLKEIATEFEVDLERAPYVGDSLRDLIAAQTAGCEPVLVLTGKGQITLTEGLPAELRNTRVYPDLAAFVDAQLKTGAAK